MLLWPQGQCENQTSRETIPLWNVKILYEKSGETISAEVDFIENFPITLFIVFILPVEDT